jgi:hypothetical protein
MNERRAHPRRDVRHRGILSYNDGRSAITCQLVNVSDGGVLVRVDTPQLLPSVVSLIYDRLDEHVPEVVSAFCTVVRRESKMAALKFVPAA